MPDYEIFGGCLRSDVPFPELRERAGLRIDWTLHSTDDAAPSGDGAVWLGSQQITPACQVRMFRRTGGFRLQYDDTGAFDLSDSGRNIVWHRGPDPAPSAVRSDVTGRVLAAALHMAGRICLHGSAVSFPAGAVAFLAPKYHGKSTLAYALTRAGARLITDDVLPVEPGAPPRAIPGVPQVKLWDDTAARMGVRAPEREPGEKHLVHDFSEESLVREPTPLIAAYLLAPVTGATASTERERLADVHAALALVRHTSLGALLGGSEAAVVFERAAALARAVPVYRLSVPAGLERLGAVVERLQRWHDGGVLASAASSRQH